MMRTGVELTPGTDADVMDINVQSPVSPLPHAHPRTVGVRGGSGIESDLDSSVAGIPLVLGVRITAENWLVAAVWDDGRESG